MIGLIRMLRAIAAVTALLFDLGADLVVPAHADQQQVLNRVDDALPPSATYKDSEIAIKAEDRVSGPVLIFKKFGTPPQLVGLPNDILRIDSIRRVLSHSAVVVGQVTASGQEGLIYDLVEVTIRDKFFGYDLSVSPDGHYVAFTRFFPAHFVTAEQASNYLMLYDLRRSASGARALGVDTHDMVDVGVQLYPADVPQDGLDPAAPARQTHVFMEDKFFWSADSSKLVLLDEQAPMTIAAQPTQNRRPPARPILYLVLVRVGSSGPPTVSSAPIGVCAVESGHSCYLRLVGATFGSDGVTVQLQGFLTKAAAHETVTLEYDRFLKAK